MKNMNKKVAISTRRFEENSPNSYYDEPAIEICWDEYNCGVSLQLNSRKVNVFSYDQYLQAALIIAWNNSKMSMIVRDAFDVEGEKGFIKVARFFLKAFAENVLATFEKFDAEESSVG